MEVVLAIETIQKPQSDLEEKDSPSILKDDFSLRADPSFHFLINSTRVMRPTKQNKLSPSSIEIKKSLLGSVYIVS